VELAVLSTLIAIALWVPTGVISAIKQHSMLDYVLRVISLAGLSMPSFWLGMVIILGLVAWVGWIPPVTLVLASEDFKIHVVQFLLCRDDPIVQNLVMFTAIVVILSNLLVDMMYGWLDPRVKYAD